MKEKFYFWFKELRDDVSNAVSALVTTVIVIVVSIFFAAIMVGIGLGMYQLATWLVSLF